MKVTFNTTEYENTYMHKPRGGAGWYFFTDRSASFSNGVNRHFDGTYGEAKKSARQWAQKNGIETLFVGT